MDDRAVVARQLGREPRTFRRVVARCPWGLPAVTEQEPYGADGEPFPTTYYLTCRHLVAAVSRLEAAGGVERWSAAVAADPWLHDDLERATDEQRRDPSGARGRRDAAPTAGPRSTSGSAARATRRRSSASTRTSPSPRVPRATALGEAVLAEVPAAMAAALLHRRRQHRADDDGLGGPPRVGGRQSTLRRRRRATRARADALHAQHDAILEELRRRVGTTFTLAELADGLRGLGALAARGGRGARAVAGLGATVSLAGDAAFHAYSRRRGTTRRDGRSARPTAAVAPPTQPPLAARAGRRRRRARSCSRSASPSVSRSTTGPSPAARRPSSARSSRCRRRSRSCMRGTREASPGLQLLGRLEQARDDHGDRRDEADPEADAAAGEEEVVGHRDHADEHEDRRERAERDRDEALRERRRQLDPELAQQRARARRRGRRRARACRGCRCSSRAPRS